jgi:hypothetical protein
MLRGISIDLGDGQRATLPASCADGIILKDSDGKWRSGKKLWFRKHVSLLTLTIDGLMFLPLLGVFRGASRIQGDPLPSKETRVKVPYSRAYNR